jgi:hypothetical protein
MADTKRAVGGNVDRVRAVQERRRSGGHGLHKDKRARRLGTRSAIIASSLKEC